MTYHREPFRAERLIRTRNRPLTPGDDEVTYERRFPAIPTETKTMPSLLWVSLAGNRARGGTAY